MALKMRVGTVVDIALRVPPLFVMDAVLNWGSGYASESSNLVAGQSFGLSVFCGILYVQAFLVASFTFVLSSRRLVSLYLRLGTIAVIVQSYKWNQQYVAYTRTLIYQNTSVWQEICSRNVKVTIHFLTTFCFQMALAAVFSIITGVQNIMVGIEGVVFVSPIFISFLPLPSLVHRYVSLLSAIGIMVCLTRGVFLREINICESVYQAITKCHDIVEHYGIYTLLESHWNSLHLPQVLRIFWILKLANHILSMVASGAFSSDLTPGVYGMAKEIVTSGSENIVSVLGMTSVMALVSNHFGRGVQSFLMLSDSEDKNIGNISGILFFVLALQTGLTGMAPEKRFIRLCRNICLLIVAVMHFIHNITNPLLLSLSASRSMAIGKHMRTLSVCFFLIIYPSWLLYYLWSNQPANTWLLAVTFFAMELVVKVMVSILIYTLFMLDSYYNGLWESLDDYIYYLRTFSGCTEFICGVFLFLNGSWILLFESGGAIRACMITLHAYFNVWVQARSGWDCYQKRQSSVKKISCLPEATIEQLKELNDVCSICFQDLNHARITHCNHYFHGICLSKWLNVQDNCPLCHTNLSEICFDKHR